MVRRIRAHYGMTPSGSLSVMSVLAAVNGVLVARRARRMCVQRNRTRFHAPGGFQRRRRLRCGRGNGAADGGSAAGRGRSRKRFRSATSALSSRTTNARSCGDGARSGKRVDLAESARRAGRLACDGREAHVGAMQRRCRTDLRVATVGRRRSARARRIASRVADASSEEQAACEAPLKLPRQLEGHKSSSCHALDECKCISRGEVTPGLHEAASGPSKSTRSVAMADSCVRRTKCTN